MLVRNLLPLVMLTAFCLFTTKNVEAAPAAGDVIITEIMYNSVDSDEWIEIYNTTSSSITLDTRWRLTYGSSTYDFTGTVIGANSYLTIGLSSNGDGTFNNSNSFTPSISTIGTPIATVNDQDNLADGTTLTLVYDPSGANTTIDEVTFTTSSPWDSKANGDGPSLELIHESMDNNSGGNWQGSVLLGGSPGVENSKYLESSNSNPDIATSSHWTYGSGSFNAAPSSIDNVTVASGHNLEISSTVTIQDLTITGDVTIASGTVTVRDININSSANLSNSGTLSLDDLFQNKGSGVTLGGTVNFDQGGTSQITSGDVAFTGNVNLTSSTTLDIGSGITVSIESGASFIQTSGSVTGDDMQIKRTGLTETLAYNIWSSPVAVDSIKDVFDGSNPCDVYVYDEIDQAWKYDYPNNYSASCNTNPVTFTSGILISNSDGAFDVGRGYYAPGAASSTRTFTGKPNSGTINLTLGTSGDAWNLIGNPYPCAVDLDALATTNTSNFNGDFYFWIDDKQGGSGNTNDDFGTYNESGGAGSPVNGVSITDYLASGQGFWIEATSSTFTFQNSHKVSSNNGTFYKRSNTEIERSWLSISNAELSNQILIAFNENATNSYDKHYDAVKWEGNPNMYFASICDSQELIIQGLPTLTPNVNKVIPLKVKIGISDMYMIELDSLQNFSNPPQIIIEDVLLNKQHDLSNGGYNVYLDANKQHDNRFFVHYYQTQVTPDSSGTVNVSERANNIQVKAYVSGGAIQVEANEPGAQFMQIDLIDIQGRIVTQLRNTSGRIAAIPNNYPRGVYFVRYMLKNGKNDVVKMIVQ